MYCTSLILSSLIWIVDSQRGTEERVLVELQGSTFVHAEKFKGGPMIVSSQVLHQYVYNVARAWRNLSRSILCSRIFRLTLVKQRQGAHPLSFFLALYGGFISPNLASHLLSTSTLMSGTFENGSHMYTIVHHRHIGISVIFSPSPGVNHGNVFLVTLSLFQSSVYVQYIRRRCWQRWGCLKS